MRDIHVLGLDLPLRFPLNRVYIQHAVVLFLDELFAEAHPLSQFDHHPASFLPHQQNLLVMTAALQRISSRDEC